jgi:hypothetical protein
LDPHYDQPELKGLATQSYLQAKDYVMNDEVLNVANLKIDLHTNIGPGKLVRFSKTGIVASLQTEVVGGTILTVSVGEGSQSKIEFDVETGLNYRDHDFYYHEFKFVTEDPTLFEKLMQRCDLKHSSVA